MHKLDLCATRNKTERGNAHNLTQPTCFKLVSLKIDVDIFKMKKKIHVLISLIIRLILI